MKIGTTFESERSGKATCALDINLQGDISSRIGNMRAVILNDRRSYEAALWEGWPVRQPRERLASDEFSDFENALHK